MYLKYVKDVSYQWGVMHHYMVLLHYTDKAPIRQTIYNFRDEAEAKKFYNSIKKGLETEQVLQMKLVN